MQSYHISTGYVYFYEWPRLVTSIALKGRVLSLRSSHVEEPASLFALLEASEIWQQRPMILHHFQLKISFPESNFVSRALQIGVCFFLFI
jgi:hypothetical protein